MTVSINLTYTQHNLKQLTPIVIGSPQSEPITATLTSPNVSSTVLGTDHKVAVRAGTLGAGTLATSFEDFYPFLTINVYKLQTIFNLAYLTDDVQNLETIIYKLCVLTGTSIGEVDLSSSKGRKKFQKV